MYVTLTIHVNEGDSREATAKAPEELAVDVLTLLGGDPETDTCTVTVTASGGSVPPLPSPPNVLDPRR